MVFVKRHLASVMAGLVIVGGASFVATQALTAAPSDNLTLTQDSSAGPQSPSASSGAPGAPGRTGLPRAVRGEALVHSPDGTGFDNVKFDRGVLDHVDGTTVVITEDDGTSVSIPTEVGTRIGRDGHRATLADLQAGDHIAVLRVKDGDAYVTKGIRAISPERWQQFMDRRSSMQQQRRDTRPGRRAPSTSPSA